MFREVKEETGLVPVQYRLCGVVTFLSDMGTEKEAWEYMFLYHITDYKGTMKECDEGVLEWIPKKTFESGTVGRRPAVPALYG